ncbi:hypothetical protein F4860DRAFT_523342 [Xylaria cubensis]|nr:hypothetical protein F4860DRAFT_523342 [Xylaria cubensis]
MQNMALDVTFTAVTDGTSDVAKCTGCHAIPLTPRSVLHRQTAPPLSSGKGRSPSGRRPCSRVIATSGIRKVANSLRPASQAHSSRRCTQSVIARSGAAAGTANRGIDRGNDVERSRKEPLHHPEIEDYYNCGRKFTELTALEAAAGDGDALS